jgi:hypothetical protein
MEKQDTNLQHVFKMDKVPKEKWANNIAKLKEQSHVTTAQPKPQNNP